MGFWGFKGFGGSEDLVLGSGGKGVSWFYGGLIVSFDPEGTP